MLTEKETERFEATLQLEISAELAPDRSWRRNGTCGICCPGEKHFSKLLVTSHKIKAWKRSQKCVDVL